MASSAGHPDGDRARFVCGTRQPSRRLWFRADVFRHRTHTNRWSRFIGDCCIFGGHEAVSHGYLDFALSACPIALERPIIWAQDYIHLALAAWLGAGCLVSCIVPHNASFAYYDWSVGLVSNGNTFLIRDQTDRLSQPLSPNTKVDDPSGFMRQCAGQSGNLLGHYYICHF